MLAVSSCLDTIRGCADQAKKCAECFITSQVTIRTQRWTGGELGAGSKVASDLVLPKRFPIRELRSSETRGPAGRYQAGDLIVEDISPAYSSHGGGGFTVEQLNPKAFPTPNPDIEVLYLIDGDEKGVFTLVDLDSVTDPTSWNMVLRRTHLNTVGAP